MSGEELLESQKMLIQYTEKARESLPISYKTKLKELWMQK